MNQEAGPCTLLIVHQAIMIYDAGVINAILIAHLLNATIKTLPLLEDAPALSMYGGTSASSPGTQTHVFNVITPDTYKDGWITISPPPQQHAPTPSITPLHAAAQATHM